MSWTQPDTVDDPKFLRLSRACLSLAAALHGAARELSASGLPVPAALLQDALNVRQQVLQLAADSGSATPLRDAGELSWKRIVEQQERRLFRIRARQALLPVLQLQHIDQPEFAPLVACQHSATQLLRRMDEGATGDWLDVEIADIVHEKHPLLAVGRLAFERETLTDDVWAELQDRVAEIYGMQLATALVRGKIVATSAATPVSPAKESPAVLDHQSPTISPDPNTAQLIFETPAPPPPRRWSIRPDVAIAEFLVAAQTDPVSSEIIEPAQPAAEPEVAVLPDTKTVVTAPLQPVSIPQEQREVPRETDHIASSVMKLIREERYDLAVHLVQASEARFALNCPVSAQLLRACALARSISYPRGELATQFDRDLRQLPPLPPRTFEADDVFGVGLLVRAACLPAALLGASPAATTLLRSFPIEPGTSRLYNFCSRVAAFGERMQGFAAEMFQATADESSWRNEEARLLDDVNRWWEQLSSRSVGYTRASPLYVHAHWTVTTRPAQRQSEQLETWLTWQNVLTQIDLVIRPLRNPDRADRQRIKSDVLRLMNWLESPTSQSEPRTLLHLSELQQNIVREALELAHRWLRLEASAPQKARVLPSQAQAELLEDLRQRMPSVLLELEQLAVNRASGWINTGAVVCRHMTEYLQRLCAGQQTLALEEPPLNVVLNARMLKVPQLELDSQWQPTQELRDALPQLLDAVHQEEPTWRDAFELQSQQGDHLATLRLLELPVWTAEERQTLQQLRLQRLEQCRQKVHANLSELITQIQASVDARRMSAESSEEWTERADRLLVAIPRTISFQRLWSQIDALRTAWQRASTGESRRMEFISETGETTMRPLAHAPLTNGSTVSPDAADSAPADWVF